MLFLPKTRTRRDSFPYGAHSNPCKENKALDFSQFTREGRLLPDVAHAGYVTPKAIQTAVISAVLAGHDLIGMDQTGMGNAAAFVLPVLHRLLAGPRGRSRALSITPTRE